jgi:hypothetical protein
VAAGGVETGAAVTAAGAVVAGTGVTVGKSAVAAAIVIAVVVAAELDGALLAALHAPRSIATSAITGHAIRCVR